MYRKKVLNKNAVQLFKKGSLIRCSLQSMTAWYSVLCSVKWCTKRGSVYLKHLFKTPCSNRSWGWNMPIMLDYRDISLMESVPLLWRPLPRHPWELNPWSFRGPPLIINWNWNLIHNGRLEILEFYVLPGLAPQYPLWLCWSTGTQVADATCRDTSMENMMINHTIWGYWLSP